MNRASHASATAAPSGAASSGGLGPIVTIPNVISFLRLLGVPVFCYLLLGPKADVAAVVVLAVGGTTDWVDGFLARRLNQVSRLGELMDPLADRLYILATLVTFTIRDIVPWQFTAALLLRDAMMIVCLLVLRRNGYGPPQVHYIGKTATFILLAAFPMLLLARVTGSAWWSATAWALAWWGIVLYWIAGLFYVIQAAAAVRAARRSRAAVA